MSLSAIQGYSPVTIYSIHQGLAEWRAHAVSMREDVFDMHALLGSEESTSVMMAEMKKLDVIGEETTGKIARVSTLSAD